ncbi:MAG TPA: regulatory protein GemA [Paucimonas sp.]|nr:regulatory protein GemA [Paucimonas sp.]
MGRWYGNKVNSGQSGLRLKQLIHIAKSQLGMDDDTYRAMLGGLELPDSTTKMTVPQLNVVLEHLKRSGFKVRSKSKPASKPAQSRPSRPLAQDSESKKIRALWLFLHELGVVKNPSEEALAAYIKRIAGVDALQWVNGEQAERLIETMKKWAMRFLPQTVKELALQVGELPLSDFERGQLNAVLNKAFSRLTFDPMHSAWESLTDVLKKGR